MTTDVAKEEKNVAEKKTPIAKKLVESANAAVEDLKAHVRSLEESVNALGAELNRYQSIDIEEVKKFLREPWLLLRKNKEEWWVIVPRFVNLSFGWLERSTDSFNIYCVNRYSVWFGGVPEELRDKLELPEPFSAIVEDGRLKTTLAVSEKFNEHLWGQTGPNEFRIRKGHEFDLMAAIIDAGTLPFKPRPVDKDDLREIKPTGPLATLYDYQKEGWEKFLEYGATGIYWPFGQGKTVFGMYAIANLKGKKLIVVPSTTLVEQWEERLQRWLDIKLRQDVEVITYHAWERVNKEEYMLVVFDESHRLPADTFSRLASIRTKYRIGLSATPKREDGRENYIIALTGFPVGMDWTEFVRTGKIKPPDIEVRIVKSWDKKVQMTVAEVKSVKGMTIVFCDGIAKGEEIAKKLHCPHVHGQTQNRLELLRDTKVAVVSRVGDEGLSLPDLRQIIEVDFHGGSRRQEAQRVGRLLHADAKGKHLVLMEQTEFDKFENRFLALEEKGFRIQIKTV